MECVNLKLCKFCDSGNIVKKGIRKNKSSNVQVYKCLEYQKRFTTNFGFEKSVLIKLPLRELCSYYIKLSLQNDFTGMSVRNIANHYEMMGIKINTSSVYRWIVKILKWLKSI